VLRDRAEAEDAVQEAYLKAFAAIGGFEGRSSLSTWLTRIVINEALEHRRTAEKRQRILREQSVIDIDDYQERLMARSEASQSPEAETMRTQIAKLLGPRRASHRCRRMTLSGHSGQRLSARRYSREEKPPSQVREG
jgi:RNA polymerase sigma-70 factor (ECF subfamily)